MRSATGFWPRLRRSASALGPRRLLTAWTERRRQRDAWFLDEPGPRFALRDLAGQSIAGILGRPGRWIIAGLGAAAGLSLLTAAWGVHETVADQIDPAFTTFAATTVTVTEYADPQRLGDEPDAFGQTAFPADADHQIDQVPGVQNAGLYWQLPVTATPQIRSNATSAPAPSDAVRVFAATATAVAAIGPHMTHGVVPGTFAEASHQRVAIVSQQLAGTLDLGPLSTAPSLLIGSVPYTVIGIYDTVQRGQQVAGGVIIPETTAVDEFGLPDPAIAPVTMIIQTGLGAAQTVAAQAAWALRPDAPGAFVVTGPPPESRLTEHVQTSITRLLLSAAAVALALGTFTLAHAASDSARERSGEFGLRRAVGARRSHVAAQLLTESALVGALAGLFGSALGVGLVVLTAEARHWTAHINPLSILAGPPAAALLGLLAGSYAAMRTALADPGASLEADPMQYQHHHRWL